MYAQCQTETSDQSTNLNAGWHRGSFCCDLDHLRCPASNIGRSGRLKCTCLSRLFPPAGIPQRLLCWHLMFHLSPRLRCCICSCRVGSELGHLPRKRGCVLLPAPAQSVLRDPRTRGWFAPNWFPVWGLNSPLTRAPGGGIGDLLVTRLCIHWWPLGVLLGPRKAGYVLSPCPPVSLGTLLCLFACKSLLSYSLLSSRANTLLEE